jgi:hypothetical protein
MREESGDGGDQRHEGVCRERGPSDSTERKYDRTACAAQNARTGYESPEIDDS